MPEDSAVNLAHARGKTKEVYEKIMKDKTCPFCTDFSKRGVAPQYHTKPIITDGKYWVLTENFNAYKGAKYHFLIVHRKHITSFSELKPAALKELVTITKRLKEEFSLPAGVLLFRFGDTEYTGGSVNHFHAHFILGAKCVDGGENKPLLLYAGYASPDT
ncbi:hypothetical protein AUJ77_03220 [Candidatus Nomurabacteria bacterium CG1_02_43_90]|uniref:HIT domain-containing protein n=1 Tax=Candidatus Nomurabacteria bacterium CG1_02_43_90 TaxID=1805281 RepID=A0A1J4V383_9BACT|nr:MAG: hypothetical protein AUJ77_03220 [Candidatus Nomurabacteria bacterium CG1_02_43_90]